MTTKFSNNCYVISPISLSQQPIQTCNIRRSCNLHSYCMTLYKYITCTCCGNICTLTMPFVYKEHVLLLNMIIYLLVKHDVILLHRRRRGTKASMTYRKRTIGNTDDMKYKIQKEQNNYNINIYN